MATIDIRRPHSLSDADARVKAEELAQAMERKFGIRWSWQGDTLSFDTPAGAARGTCGKVSLSAREVRVEIDLPTMFRPLKSIVEGKIRGKLDAALGPR